MKINWKVRFKNKVWLGSFLSLIIGFIYSMLALFDIFPEVTQNLVVQMMNQVLTFLGLIGVIVDPTTAGIADSERAMGIRSRIRRMDDGDVGEVGAKTAGTVLDF